MLGVFTEVGFGGENANVDSGFRAQLSLAKPSLKTTPARSTRHGGGSKRGGGGQPAEKIAA